MGKTFLPILNDAIFWFLVLAILYFIAKRFISLLHLVPTKNTSFSLISGSQECSDSYTLDWGVRKVSLLAMSQTKGASYRRIVAVDSSFAPFHRIDFSSKGQLWAADFGFRVSENARRLVLLEVGDRIQGVKKRHLLCVPPDSKKVDQALAWTFSMSAEEYKPILEA